MVWRIERICEFSVLLEDESYLASPWNDRKGMFPVREKFGEHFAADRLSKLLQGLDWIEGSLEWAVIF